MENYVDVYYDDYLGYNPCVPWDKNSIKNVIIEEGVTSIGDYAFEKCSNFTSITIPNSVTSIGKSAFKYCRGLTSITIPNNVVSIGRNAFDGTKWYDDQPDGIVYAGLVLYKYKGTMPENTKIEIKEGTKGIADYAFCGCANLTAFSIPNSVTSIGGCAFDGTKWYNDQPYGLVYAGSFLYKYKELEHHLTTSINIKEGTKGISGSAFSKCFSIYSVTIPNSVTNIGENAFSGCGNLSYITIPNSVTRIEDGTFSDCQALASITIPNSVTSIGDSAFHNCITLASFTIPNAMTKIGKSAFDGCTNLTSITIPNSVTNIGAFTFRGCSNLTSVTIPNSVKNIGEYAFGECASLTSVTIPNSVTSIGDGAFYRCSSLTSIAIPNSVSSIGGYAFYETKWYDNQPDGLVYMGLVLYACKGKMPVDTKIDIKEGTKGISSGAFYGCSVASITIPNSVMFIGRRAFYCGIQNLVYNAKRATVYTDNETVFSSSVKTVTIGNGVEVIPDYFLFENSNITSITIPNSVTSIGEKAFYWCKSLTSVTISNGVTSIGERAFYHCLGLTSISIPNSVTSIGEGAFSSCRNLTSITVPNSVTSIEKDVFCYCTSLTSITIPNSVTSIGNSAFYGCSGLTSITIPNSVTNIGNAAFSQCSSLSSITIPNSVTSIGQYAFWDCDALKKAAIEVNNDLHIEYQVFTGGGLEELIMIGETLPKYTNDYFAEGLYKTTALYVPSSLYEEYRSTSPWSNFANVITFEQRDEVNKAASEAVIAKIKAIGKVEYTDACKGKIDAASTAYDALTDEQKALVTNLDVLTTAQQTYDNLKAAAEKLAADKAVANPVIAKINAIGKVEYTDACKSKIDDANTAYNALTADQKALVTNLDVLTTAQQTYDNLKVAAEKLAANKAAFDKYKSEIITIIESLIKEDDSDAVKDIINKAINEIDALKYEEVISLDDNKAKVNSFATSVNEAVEKQRVEDEKTTSIEELEFAEKVNIYDLNGRKITNSMLKSGLYIRNGKKVVVK